MEQQARATVELPAWSGGVRGGREQLKLALVAGGGLMADCFDLIRPLGRHNREAQPAQRQQESWAERQLGRRAVT